MKKLYLYCLFLSFLFITYAQQSAQNCLGYPEDTKLLIIHADDLGVAHSENMASIEALEKGYVTSASIMAPGPWFLEIANYAQMNPQFDFGLHITLTSEWKNYKWRSIADNVSSLLTPTGYFAENVEEFSQMVRIEDAEKEIRAQIERATKLGIDLTHLDTHMFSMAANEELLALFIEMSHEYQVPIPLPAKMVQTMTGIDIARYTNEKDVLLENLFMAGPKDYQNGLDEYYEGVLTTLTAGLNLILIHTAYDDQEMRAITVDHTDYGAQWRQQDWDFFSGEKCAEIIKEQNIQLVTWKNIRDKCIRN